MKVDERLKTFVFTSLYSNILHKRLSQVRWITGRLNHNGFILFQKEVDITEPKVANPF